MALIKANSKVVGIESYGPSPAPGQTGSQDLTALLAIPPLALGGVDTKVGFQATVDLANTAGTTGSSTYYAQDGLTFSQLVIDSLLAGGTTLQAELFGSGSAFTNLDAFFAAGGSITGNVKLITVDKNSPGGGGGNPVPEPGSMLVWGALAAGALMWRRKQASKA